jgi:hypothetical protein
MSISTIVYLLVRVAHVATAALWFGATAFLVLYLVPTVQQSGPAGGQVMSNLTRRGFNNFMASVAGTTVLSGIWLYWRFTGGFDPVVSSTHAGIAFGVGGLSGLIALIIGGSIVGRGGKKMLELGDRIPSTPEGPARAALMQEIAAVRARTGAGAKAVLALVGFALVLMTLAHYI